VILVDTNVLIDVATEDPIWSDWSQLHLELAGASDELAINDVVYAELCIRAARIEDIESIMLSTGLILARIPRAALFIAGKAFQRYRDSGGVRTGVLPDFFLGAHALAINAQLLTRDTRRYRTYFPDLTLIAPTHN